MAHRFLKDGFKVISEVRTAEFKDRKKTLQKTSKFAKDLQNQVLPHFH